MMSNLHQGRGGERACMRLEALENRKLLSASLSVGAIGDSYTDEYAFYAPDRSTAQNYIEQLAEDRSIDFGSFTTASRGTPRNAGFEFNWAQSGDTTGDLLADNQLGGLAAQAIAGKVDVAFVFAGGNDFRGVFTSADPVAALGKVVPTALTNILTAAQTLLASAPKLKILIATVPKVSVLPEVKGAIAAGILPQALASAVDVAIHAFDEQIRQFAATNDRVALADVDGLVDDIFSKKHFKVGETEISRDVPSDHPSSLFLADGIHAGTVGQGLLANVFLQAMNDEFRLHYRLLTPHEILQNAGLLHGHLKLNMFRIEARACLPSTPHLASAPEDELDIADLLA